MSEAKRMSEDRLADIKAWADAGMPVGSVGALFQHIAALEAELAAARTECDRLAAVRDAADARVRQLDAELYDQRKIQESNAAVVSSTWKDHEQQFAGMKSKLEAARSENERLRDVLRQIIAASETHVGGNGIYYSGVCDGLKTAAYIAGQALSKEEQS